MKYAYEDLSPTQFEELATAICQELLGIATQGFATGPDGGRDARFVGTAQSHPSATAPWAGIVVIQAKHTNGVNRTFSESDFFSTSNANSIVGAEVPRITRLRKQKKLDHYMLFANRRLGANANDAILAHISRTCDVPRESVFLCGVEAIELYLKRYRHIPAMLSLDPLESPLLVSPDDLAAVVEALANRNDVLQAIVDDPPTHRTSYEEKNALNGMSGDFARSLRRRYLKEAAQIEAFLAAPENLPLLRLYESATEEFDLKIIAKRSEYQSFDDVMNYLFDLLFGRDPDLRANKRLTRAIVFYMYWHCDIGIDLDVEAN